MSSKRKERATPPTPEGPEATQAQRIKTDPGINVPAAASLKPVDTLYRDVTIYRALYDKEVGLGKAERTWEYEHLGTFLTITEANKAAYDRMRGPRGLESYTKGFSPEGLLTILGYEASGCHKLAIRTTVVKETMEVPPAFVVMKRNLNETMTRGERVLIATTGFKDAEETICKEIGLMQTKLRVSSESKVGCQNVELGFDIVHRPGDGRSVLSQGVVEFKDLRAEFPVVWAEGPVPMILGTGADLDENQWSEDEDEGLDW